MKDAGQLLEEKPPAGKMRHAVIAVSVTITFLAFVKACEVGFTYLSDRYGTDAVLYGVLFFMLSFIAYATARHDAGCKGDW